MVQSRTCEGAKERSWRNWYRAGFWPITACISVGSALRWTLLLWLRLNTAGSLSVWAFHPGDPSCSRRESRWLHDHRLRSYSRHYGRARARKLGINLLSKGPPGATVLDPPHRRANRFKHANGDQHGRPHLRGVRLIDAYATRRQIPDTVLRGRSPAEPLHGRAQHHAGAWSSRQPARRRFAARLCIGRSVHGQEHGVAKVQGRCCS